MRNFLFVLIGFFIIGCSFEPQMPEINGEFTYEYNHYSINDNWWKEFGDQKLNELIQSALSNNVDLLIALNNIEKARASMNLAKLEYLPNIKLDGSASRTRTSGELPNYPDNVKYNNFSLSAILSYEIDLWGKVRNTAKAQEATFKATQYDFQNARLSIASNVANAYFTLISLNEQEEILKNTVKTYEETLDYRQKELNNGIVTELVYYQAKSTLDSAKTQLIALQDSIVKIQTALAVLTGSDLESILHGNIKAPSVLPTINNVPNGISSDILLHRADVASALERLKATNALIGVAKANYFPSFSLTGLFGFASDDLNHLFTSNASTWNMGGSLVMPLLDFGRTYNKVELAKLEQNATLLNYDKTLKNAFAEIKNALDIYKNSTLKLQANHNLLNSQLKVHELAKTRYEEGYSNHLDFLDAQRLLLNARLSLAQVKLDLALATVDIYKALGGGFFKNTKIKEN